MDKTELKQYESEINEMLDRKIMLFTRVKSIEFFDFRNIEHGKIEFPNSDVSDFKENSPSVLGLYGQNGSGKTSVVMALGILKNVLSGTPLNDNYASCVRMDKQRCKLRYEFSMCSQWINPSKEKIMAFEKDCYYNVFYEFDITKEKNRTAGFILRIENERLSFKHIDSNRKAIFPKQTIIDTSDAVCGNGKYKRAFGNSAKYDMLIGKNSKVGDQLKSLKAIARDKSQSFIFSFETIEIILKDVESFVNDVVHDYYKCIETIGEDNLTNSEFLYDSLMDFTDNVPDINLLLKLKFDLLKCDFYNIISALYYFGQHHLHVVDTTITGATMTNRQIPLYYLVQNESGVYSCNDEVRIISLNMDKRTAVVEEDYSSFEIALDSVNNVLKKIIPGLSLETRNLGKSINENNEEERNFEIMSNRNGVVIPLKYESDGVRRICSILSLLIVMYNYKHITVAIDEIDTGIFEYLLGEILQILSESARGQLIFTAHNLRPLEVLPAKSLCFTTINAENRFITMPCKGNSNMRDTYFRNIVLGTSSESIYNPTDKYEIGLAFASARKTKDEI